MGDICGAVSALPPEFIEIQRRVLGLDYSGVKVTCISEPHPAEDCHFGLLILNGDVRGDRCWQDPPTEPAG